MKKLDTNKRVQILIQNLLEKRKSNWLDGVFSEEIPKKISELHQEYKQEQTSNAKINPYNKIAINNRVEKKSIFGKQNYLILVIIYIFLLFRFLH